MKCALLLGLAACGGKKETAGNNPPPSVDGLPAELAAWHPKDALTAWQGSYTTRMALRDPLEAEEVVLDVKGESAKGFDGTKEYPLGFSIIAPCIAAFEQAVTEGKMAGSTTTHAKQFVIKDGTLIAAEGGVGMRKGKAAIVCQYGADKIVTLDDKGTCKSWDDDGTWTSKPIECAWGTTEDGKQQLTVGTITTLIADGDLLFDARFRLQRDRKFHERHASYDAAKQALVSHKRETVGH